MNIDELRGQTLCVTGVCDLKRKEIAEVAERLGAKVINLSGLPFPDIASGQ
jgi:hypothetical protein